MKKVESEMRAEYKRADFAKLERGKFFKEMANRRAVVLNVPEKREPGSNNLKEPSHDQKNRPSHQRP